MFQFLLVKRKTSKSTFSNYEILVLKRMKVVNATKNVKQQNQDFMNEHKKVYKNEVPTSKKFKSI